MANQVQLTEDDIAILNGLPDDVILAILQCKRLKDLNKILDAKKIKQKADIVAIANKRAAHVKSSSNKILESLLDLLTPMSYVFLISDTAFTLLTAIALPAIIVAGIGFFAFVAVVGVIHFIGMYKELKEQDKKKDNEFQLLALKNDCADIYLKKNSISPESNQDNHSKSEKKKTDKKIWQRMKDSLGIGVLVGGTLFYTYYAVTLALTVAFAGSVAVGILAGPIGVGVALAIAIGVGIFFGYKKYQQMKRNELLEKDRKKLQNEFDNKLELCTAGPKPENSFKHDHRKIKTIKTPGPVGFGKNDYSSESSPDLRKNVLFLPKPKANEPMAKPSSNNRNGFYAHSDQNDVPPEPQDLDKEPPSDNQKSPRLKRSGSSSDSV